MNPGYAPLCGMWHFDTDIGGLQHVATHVAANFYGDANVTAPTLTRNYLTESIVAAGRLKGAGFSIIVEVHGDPDQRDRFILHSGVVTPDNLCRAGDYGLRLSVERIDARRETPRSLDFYSTCAQEADHRLAGVPLRRVEHRRKA